MTDTTTVTMTFEDGHGKRASRTVNLVADARNLTGLAGYAWTIVLANPHLSSADIQRFLEERGHDGAQRSLSWLQRKRWMTRPLRSPGPPPDRDGNHDRAVEIMTEHPTMSAPKLARLLKEHGINRSREWVRKHRCSSLTPTIHPCNK